MAYQLCELGGYQYLYNPVENQNPLVRAVAVTEALGGRFFTDWGSDPSRQEITQTWPTMDAEFYETLQSKVAEGGTKAYTDDDGVSYTVIPMAPTFQRKTPGGDAYLGLSFP